MSSENPFNIPNEYSYLEHLTDEETETLRKLSNVSNNLRTEKINQKKLENMTIKDLYENWSKAHIDILKDLGKFSTDKYKKYFTDIDETENWWNGIVIITKAIFNILTKDGREIYVGITTIFIAIFVFFISSSK